MSAKEEKNGTRRQFQFQAGYGVITEFIGFHLAKRLLERGDEVVGIDNINDYYDVNLKYAR